MRLKPGYGKADLRGEEKPNPGRAAEPRVVPIPQEGMDGGLITEKSSGVIPLEASPYMCGVRFEQGGIRKEYGWEKLGSALGGEILSLGRYAAVNPFTGAITERDYAIYRNGAGAAVFVYYNGAAWTGTTTGATVSAGLKHAENIQGFLCFADGSKIHGYSEGSSLVEGSDEGGAGNVLAVATDNDQITLTDDPVDEILAWNYGINVKAGFGFFTLAVEGFIGGVWEELARKTYSVKGAQQYPHEQLEFSRPAAGWPSDLRLVLTKVQTVVIFFAALTVDIEVHSFNVSVDDDPMPALEYQYWGPVVTTFDELSDESPTADYVFSFEDRLIALGGEDPQSIAGSVDGDPLKWNIRGPNNEFTGAFQISILDTSITDPLEPMMAGAKVANNVAAIFRRRSILRMQETNDVRIPVQVSDWISGLGTESPHTIAPVPGGIIFLGHDLVVYYLDGNSPSPVSVPIQQELREKLEGADLASVEGRYDEVFGEYKLSLPNSSGFASSWFVLDVGRMLTQREPSWRPLSLSCPATPAGEFVPEPEPDPFVQPEPDTFHADFPIILEPHPTEDAFFIAMGRPLGRGGVVRYKASDLTVDWDVESHNFGSPTLNSARGMAYVPATNELWMWAQHHLVILNASTGASLATIDISAIASESSPAYDEFTGPTGGTRTGMVVGNLLYLTAGDTDRVGNADFSITVFNVTTRTKVTEGYFTNVNSPIPKWLVGGRFYFRHSNLHRAVDPSTLTELAASDHGNLDGAGFSDGTGLAPIISVQAQVFDPTRSKFYFVGIEFPSTVRWQIVNSGIAGHADLAGGGPHDPAHNYLPSTTNPAEAWPYPSALGEAAWHSARGKMVMSALEAGSGDAKMLLVSPATVAGAVPAVDASIPMGAEGVTNMIAYVPAAGMAVAAWAGSFGGGLYQTLVRNFQ